MIAVKQNIAHVPLAVPPGAGPSFVDGPEAGANGFLKAFLSDEAVAIRVDEAQSGPERKQEPLEELNDTAKGDPTDSPADGETAILPPIAHFILKLPLPDQQSFASTVETSVSSLAAQPEAEDVGAPEKTSETPEILDKALGDSAANAKFEPALKSDIQSAATSQVPTGQVQFGTPDAPSEAASIGSGGRKRQFSAPIVLAAPKVFDAKKTSTMGETASLLLETDLLDGAIDLGQAHKIGTKPKVDLGAIAAETDAKIHAVKTKNPSTISSVESAWRQKWAADDAAVQGKDSSALGHTLSLSNVDAAQQAGRSLTPVSTLSVAGQTDPIQGTSTMLVSGAVLKASPASKSITPSAPFPNIEDDIGEDWPSVDPAESKIEATSAPVSQPDYGARVAAPQHPTNNVLLQPSGAATASLPATIVPTLIKMAKTHDNGPLELALSPEELGRLTISIKQDGHSVHVTLTAERPETLDLMRRHCNDLVADLRHAGYAGAFLSFGQNGQDAPPRFARVAPDEKHLSPEQNTHPETTPTVPRQLNTGSGVDLRL